MFTFGLTLNYVPEVRSSNLMLRWHLALCSYAIPIFIYCSGLFPTYIRIFINLFSVLMSLFSTDCLDHGFSPITFH